MKKWFVLCLVIVSGYIMLAAGCNKAEETTPENTAPARKGAIRPPGK
jgi:hypothetical protein